MALGVAAGESWGEHDPRIITADVTPALERLGLAGHIAAEVRLLLLLLLLLLQSLCILSCCCRYLFLFIVLCGGFGRTLFVGSRLLLFASSLRLR